jgi:peptidyl-prolyl cis-trans isomerase A (cyclophilin A)
MNRALLALIFASVTFSGALVAQTPANTGRAGSKSDGPTKAPPPAAAKASTAPATAAAGDLLNPASLKATAPATFRVKMTTTKGDIVMELTRAWAPRGVDRFYNLVRAGYFTDCPFYRVMPNFMAQFGVSARPEVNRAWKNANIQDDPRNAQSNKRGKVTFATTGAPNSRGTALFINIGDNGYLDQGFVPIGEVIEGMEHVDMLYNLYGDTSPRQFDFENGGKAYVDKTFPKLDRILTAVTIANLPVPAAAAPAPKQ